MHKQLLHDEEDSHLVDLFKYSKVKICIDNAYGISSQN